MWTEYGETFFEKCFIYEVYNSLPVGYDVGFDFESDTFMSRVALAATMCEGAVFHPNFFCEVKKVVSEIEGGNYAV